MAQWVQDLAMAQLLHNFSFLSLPLSLMLCLRVCTFVALTAAVSYTHEISLPQIGFLRRKEGFAPAELTVSLCQNRQRMCICHLYFFKQRNTSAQGGKVSKRQNQRWTRPDSLWAQREIQIHVIGSRVLTLFSRAGHIFRADVGLDLPPHLHRWSGESEGGWE